MNKINHVAIIMDGNGRWANLKCRPRIWGHIRGSSRVSEIVDESVKLGIKSLTLFAFSTENWKRPIEEINTLFKLLEKYIKKERSRIISNNIKFKVIGNLKGLSQKTIELIENLEFTTSQNSGLNLNFAFNFGGRDDMARTFNRILKKVLAHSSSYSQDQISRNFLETFQVTEEMISENSLLEKSGDIDLLIRTGGDFRISNFALWQLAYAELYFTKGMWPDFTKNEFRQIITEVSNRERRFGGIKSQVHNI
jgi:undecaprenyl diphosphate synthase